MGLTKDGTSVGKYSLLESTIPNPFQVFTDSQNVVYYSCSFEELGSAGHVTEVTMVRQQGVKARGDGDILRQPVTRAQDATLLSRHSSQRIASSGRGLL
jgi:hypothetical protein